MSNQLEELYGTPEAALRAEIKRLRDALVYIANYPKMRQATRIKSIMEYARQAERGSKP